MLTSSNKSDKRHSYIKVSSIFPVSYCFVASRKMSMANISFTQQKERRPYPSTWKMLLDQSLRNRAEEAVIFVADCMRDPEYVQQIARTAKDQLGSALFWDLTFPSSAAHLALFYHHVALCFPDADWQTTSHRYLKLIATNSQRHGVGAPALFGGISGIAFAIQQCSEAGRYYRQTLAHLNCAH